MNDSAGIIVSLAGPPESSDVLRRFYLRARPPGFWGPVAQWAGVDPGAGRRRLARGLAATLLAATSIFAVLVGAGSWMVGSPPPVAWPAGSGAWIASLLCLGVGAVPLWRG